MNGDKQTNKQTKNPDFIISSVTPQCMSIIIPSLLLHPNTPMYFLTLKELYWLPLDAVPNHIIPGSFKRKIFTLLHFWILDTLGQSVCRLGSCRLHEKKKPFVLSHETWRSLGLRGL